MGCERSVDREIERDKVNEQVEEQVKRNVDPKEARYLFFYYFVACDFIHKSLDTNKIKN
ncbi:hypothetical protein LguiB_034610 [Lonicera macranthoides]